MIQITAEMVKELREKTGAGMMDCKKALAETGNMEAAITYLREKGLAAAAKKAGRIASEGIVAICSKDNLASMVEVNCETDFVARNPDFQALASDLAEQVLHMGKNTMQPGAVVDGSVLLQQPFFKDSVKTVESLINEKVATIGEKIAIRRATLCTEGNVYGSYTHGGGSIGVIVELTVDNPQKAKSEALASVAKDVAMHVAAAAPLFLNRAGVDAKTIESERHIFRQQVLEQGKPENIVDRIVDGKLEKYFTEVCLLEQKFVKDPDTSISKLIEKTSKEIGAQISLNRFVRFKVGEGLEKKADDFAEEVAKMVAH